EEGIEPDLLTALVSEYCTDAVERAEGDVMQLTAQVRRFATFLVLLAGRQDAETAVKRAASEQVNDQATLVLLGRALDLIEEPEPDEELLEHARIGIAAMVKALDDLPAATGELMAMLSSMPGLSMDFLTAELLKGASAHPKREHFAIGVMLTPCAQAARCRAAQWLLDLGGKGAREWLERITPAEVGDGAYRLIRKSLAKGQPAPRMDKGTSFGDFSLSWPITEALATQPDGQGSQGLYLVRAMPHKKYALAGAVVSDIRGIADGLEFVGITGKDVAKIKRDFSRDDSVLVFPVEPAYVLTRIRQGIALASHRGMPLPLELDMALPWFAGLWDLPEVDVMGRARSWARPELLSVTGALPYDPVCASWFLTPDGSAESERFFEEVAEPYGDPDRDLSEECLQDAVGPWVDRVLAPLRETLAERLAHVAYLFDQAGDRNRRDLAATASAALLAEGSLAEVAFASALVKRSAELAAEYEEGSDEFEFDPPLDALARLRF
ncbi:MAG: hypothetical protein KGR26_08970, partial [Cyanobacteria bacterium REEB65]|nr:hypothetical protein [Cyanobacteria bacterium REEB65]